MSRKVLLIPVLFVASLLLAAVVSGCFEDAPTQPREATAAEQIAAREAPAPQSPLQLVQPNGGERLSVGEVYTITWIYPVTLNITPDWIVTISLSKDGGKSYPIQIGQVNYPLQKFEWSIKGDVTTTARIQLVLSDPKNTVAPYVTSSAKDFEIQPLAPISIKLPDGN